MPEFQVSRMQDLLQRISAGDREAAAELAVQYGPRIRRRIAGKLGPRLRRIFDSQDILSTVLRRLDIFVAENRLDIASEGQLWALIMAIANRAVIDKLRILRRLEMTEGADRLDTEGMRRRLLDTRDERPQEIEVELERAFISLPDETDRTILWFWLSGMEHRQTSMLVGLTPAATRKRWERIRGRLREVFTVGVPA